MAGRTWRRRSCRRALDPVTPQLSLELISAIASVVTAVVIGATAVAAIVQLRHLRMNNQITALLAVQAEFDAKDFRDAEALVRREFPEIFDDEGFCAYWIAVLRDEQPIEHPRYVEARHAARLVANTYENLGVLVKRGIIDKSLLLDVYAYIVASSWDELQGFVALVRSLIGEQTLYVNFEYLASIARDSLASNVDPYPREAKRLDARLPEVAAKLLRA
jgi:hypothetical protein